MLDLKLLNKLSKVNIPTIDTDSGVFKYENKVPYNIEPDEVREGAMYRNTSIRSLIESYSTPMEKCVSMVATFYLARHDRQEYDLFMSKHKDNVELVEAQHSIYNTCRTIAELISENCCVKEEVAKAIFTSSMIVLILYNEPDMVHKFNISYLSQVEILCDILKEFEGPTRTVFLTDEEKRKLSEPVSVSSFTAVSSNDII